MRPPEDQVCRTLIPFDRREAISVKEAAGLAATSGNTIRNWCIRHGIGRRVGGGVWRVSKVALKMLLDGDMPALAAYVYGDRSSELVLLYFRHFNLNPQDAQSSHSSPKSQTEQKQQASHRVVALNRATSNAG
ncbi:hypothetical protein [Bradyrhizobium sp. LB5.2]|uniref:hypothetical protein n=2 Tax=unclassified Bradyrhizobium TaxID=2631580 RepID=UPI0033966D04